MGIIGEFLVKLGIVGEKDIENAARRSGRAMRESGEEAEKAGGHYRRAGDNFSRFTSNVSHGLSIFDSLNGIMGAGRDLVSELIGPAVGYEALNSRLEAVTGSADSAARKLQFAQSVANPSNFTFTELADATVTLEAFGINAERNLPLIARLGMAFGSTGEDLQTLVRGLGDLSSGKFFEADLAASFGLNRDMFKGKGIKFDSGGEMLSSAEEAFAALEMIVNEKYGGIFDKMQNTYSAKLATIADITEKYKRVIGEGILSVIGPGLEKFSAVANAVQVSGVLKDSITEAAEGISKLFGAGIGEDSMISFMASALSIISQLPDAIGKTGGAIGAIFDNLLTNAQLTLEYIDAKIDFTIAKASIRIGSYAEAIKALLDPSVPLWDRGKNASTYLRMADASESMMGAFAPAPPNFKNLDLSPYRFDLMANTPEYMERIKAASQSPAAGVPEARGDFLTRQGSRVEEALDEIAEQSAATAKNTGKLAEPLSMRQQITGGGERGQIGATRAELYGGAFPAFQPTPVIKIEIKGDGILAKILRESAKIEIGNAGGERVGLAY